MNGKCREYNVVGTKDMDRWRRDKYPALHDEPDDDGKMMMIEAAATIQKKHQQQQQKK